MKIRIYETYYRDVDVPETIKGRTKKAVKKTAEFYAGLPCDNMVFCHTEYAVKLKDGVESDKSNECYYFIQEI